MTTERTTRLLLRGGMCIIFLVIFAHCVTITRQAIPWEDEVFAISTGWSIARSQPANLSVLAQYPNTGSPLRFYGPVSFEVAAVSIRVFGLSMAAWRLLCYSGLILTVFVSM